MHDQAGGEDERGACAGHEARTDKGGVGRRERAEHVAQGGEDAADRQRVAPAESVRELARGHRDEEAGEPVDRDGEPDGGLGDVEGARIEGERGDDAAEAELVDGDEHAHPDEDPDARGLSHDRLGVSLNRQGRPRPPGGPGAPGRLYPALAALEPDTSVVSGPRPGLVPRSGGRPTARLPRPRSPFRAVLAESCRVESSWYPPRLLRLTTAVTRAT